MAKKKGKGKGKKGKKMKLLWLFMDCKECFDVIQNQIKKPKDDKASLKLRKFNLDLFGLLTFTRFHGAPFERWMYSSDKKKLKQNLGYKGKKKKKKQVQIPNLPRFPELPPLNIRREAKHVETFKDPIIPHIHTGYQEKTTRPQQELIHGGSVREVMCGPRYPLLPRPQPHGGVYGGAKCSVCKAYGGICETAFGLLNMEVRRIFIPGYEKRYAIQYMTNTPEKPNEYFRQSIEESLQLLSSILDGTDSTERDDYFKVRHLVAEKRELHKEIETLTAEIQFLLDNPAKKIKKEMTEKKNALKAAEKRMKKLDNQLDLQEALTGFQDDKETQEAKVEKRDPNINLFLLNTQGVKVKQIKSKGPCQCIVGIPKSLRGARNPLFGMVNNTGKLGKLLNKQFGKARYVLEYMLDQTDRAIKYYRDHIQELLDVLGPILDAFDESEWDEHFEVKGLIGKQRELQKELERLRHELRHLRKNRDEAIKKALADKMAEVEEAERRLRDLEAQLKEALATLEDWRNNRDKKLQDPADQIRKYLQMLQDIKDDILRGRDRLRQLLDWETKVATEQTTKEMERIISEDINTVLNWVHEAWFNGVLENKKLRQEQTVLDAENHLLELEVATLKTQLAQLGAQKKRYDSTKTHGLRPPAAGVIADRYLKAKATIQLYEYPTTELMHE